MERRNGYTLTELLVVVAVLSILAATLFPTFASAVRSARTTSDREQLHQIALAHSQYVQDWGDFVPSLPGYSAVLNAALSPQLGPRWYWELQRRGRVVRMETSGTGRYRRFYVVDLSRTPFGYQVDRDGNLYPYPEPNTRTASTDGTAGGR